MNAPETITEAQLELIPITSITESGTAVQALRRKNYDPEKLLELAASIQNNGVLQPILVRPIAPKGTVKYEIVAGERRWRAADRAGLAHVPCVIRDLDDVQTLQAQLVENIEREQLSALEEATGFDEMRKNSAALNAEQIGARIGKSRSYVYARLKLLDLIPAAREALQDGTLDPTKALILARIHGEKMQARALKIINEGHYYSYRRLMEKLRDDLMIRLERAPWLPDRDTLHVPKTGAPVPTCVTCPHNSANDPELAAAIDDAEVCTERGCFELKTKWHNARILKEYQDLGHTVISGEAVKDVLDDRRGYMGSSVHNGYVRLDAEVDTIEFDEPEPEPKKGQTEDDLENDPDWQAWARRQEQFESPSYSQLLGAVVGTQLVQTAKGDIVAVAPVAAVTKALKAKGVDIPWPLKQKHIRDDDEPQRDPAKEAAERARAEERFQVEVEYRKRLLRAIHAKFKGPFKQSDLALIAETILDEAGKYILFDKLFDEKRPDLGKFKEVDLARLIIAFCLDDEADSVHTKPGRMLAYCQRLKIDPKKIRAEVVKDLKPVSAAEPETKAKAGAKK